MKILLYYSTIIFLYESVIALATAETVIEHDKPRLVRRVEPKKSSGARSVPPNGRTPLSRETKYQEAKKEAAMESQPKLERSKSLPIRPNPMIFDVATKEKQAGQALKQLRNAQQEVQPDDDGQVRIWNDYVRGRSSPAASYKSLKEIGDRRKSLLPHNQALAEAYASAGKASFDAGLTHRTMRNKLKAGSASVGHQLAKDDMRWFNNIMAGSMLPGVALERMTIRGARDPVAAHYMQTASQARQRAAERKRTVDRGEAKLTELRKTGGHDSESEGYDSEASKLP